jgi:hypothetical protein
LLDEAEHLVDFDNVNGPIFGFSNRLQRFAKVMNPVEHRDIRNPEQPPDRTESIPFQIEMEGHPLERRRFAAVRGGEMVLAVLTLVTLTAMDMTGANHMLAVAAKARRRKGGRRQSALFFKKIIDG